MSCKLIEHGEILLSWASRIQRPWVRGGTWTHPFAAAAPLLVLTAHGYIDTDAAKRLDPNDQECALMLVQAALRWAEDHEPLDAVGPSCLGAEITASELAVAVFALGHQHEMFLQRAGGEPQ